MQLPLPIAGNATGWSGHWLVERMVVRRSQDRTIKVFLGRVIPEPVFAVLVGLDDRMSSSGGMVVSVLRRRGVAAADVAATCTPAQVKPPATRGEAFDAARSAWRYRGIDHAVI